MAKGIKDTGLYEVKLKEADATTFILFIQTADAVLKYSDEALFKTGISLAKLMVLQLLVAQGGTLTPSNIARLTLREKHNITTLIRRLQRDELVQIKGSKTDRRSIHVTITEKGKQAVIDTAPAARNIVKQVMQSVPESSIAILEELLKVLRQNAYNGLEQNRKR